MITVEVVLKKEMTIEEYRKIIRSSKKKGWSIQAFETGFSTLPLGSEVK